jgi:hypothetical protein
MARKTTSYFDDYTEEEREMMRKKMAEEHQSWKEIISRFGHPSTWSEPKQMKLFEGTK